MVEAIPPTPRLNHQPEDEAAVAQVQMSEAHLADPSVPVFWILPKGLITTIFPALQLAAGGLHRGPQGAELRRVGGFDGRHLPDDAMFVACGPPN